MDEEPWVRGDLDSLLGAIRGLGPSLNPYNSVDAVERALVDGVPGASIRWSQGTAQFGLLAREGELRRLAITNSGVLQLSDLWLMLDEPHGTEADGGQVTWFRTTQPFEYRT